MQITLAPNYTLQPDGEGALLLDPRGEPYYEFDQVGMRVWQLLAANGDFEAAFSQILAENAEYAGAEDELRRELHELLDDMAQAGLVAWE